MTVSDGTNYDTRASFNPIGGDGLSSTNYQGRGVSPYTSGAFGPAPVTNTYYGRASFYSGNSSSGGSYQSRSSFDALAGAGSTSAYQGRGITPYVNGVVSGSSNPYSGPTGETTVNYTYGAGSAGPHAVTSLSNGNTYTYDANGNMTQRVEGSTTWTQTFDAENQLVSVSDGTTTTTYTYDHSGSRVRRSVTSGGVTTTTTYVAGMEIQRVGGTETQRTVYYSAGGAFRIIGGSNAGLYYRHTDHLGSTSVLSNASGQKVANSEIVYAPFGEVRMGSLPSLTDFGYTGQRHDGSTGGLMYYGARYYLPSLRRFISPDTIVPNPMDSQAFNRYSYTLNNPTRYVDPTGHTPYCDSPNALKEDCAWRPPRSPSRGHGGPSSSLPGNTEEHTVHMTPICQGCGDEIRGLLEYGITIDHPELWNEEDLQTVLRAVHDTGQAFVDAGGGAWSSPAEAFRAVYGSLVVGKGPDRGWNCVEGQAVICHGETNLQHRVEITLDLTYDNLYYLMIHELGHAFEQLFRNGSYYDPVQAMSRSDPRRENIYCGPTCPNNWGEGNRPILQASQQIAVEWWSDMFMLWVVGRLPDGGVREEFMDTYMPQVLRVLASRTRNPQPYLPSE